MSNEPTIHLVGKEKIVVTENGQRVGPVHTTLESAQAQADKRRKLAESGGNQAPAIEVKQTIYG